MLNTYALLVAMQTLRTSVDVGTEGSQGIGDRPPTPARFNLPLPLLGVSLTSWQSDSRGAPALMTAEHGTTLCPVTEKWMGQTYTRELFSAIKQEALFTGKWMQGDNPVHDLSLAEVRV